MTEVKLQQPKVLTVHSHGIRVSPFLDFTAPDSAIVGVYAGRAVAFTWGRDPAHSYWPLRQTAILFDTPENPIEINGPDATALLDKVLARDVSTLKIGRAAYGIACYEDGGILMDGILLRLDDDRYWYVQADGDFVPWLRAHAVGRQVSISEPVSQVLQVQGPNSMKVLEAACDNGAPDPFPFFSVAERKMGGQPLLISRTGWSGELGWEFYTNEKTDAEAIWNHILDAGKAFGLEAAGMGGLNIRRVEAGIMNNLTDLDPGMNPFQAGLGKFVNMDKEDFIGKAAIRSGEREQILWGLSCESAIPDRYADIRFDDEIVGRITAAVWSPFLKRGIGYGRFSAPNNWEGKTVLVPDKEGNQQQATAIQLPFYDPEKRISRGLDTTIPQRT